jgi:hypothetical protein
MPLSGENTMNQLSKEKRKQLALVLLLTSGALVGLWFGLINAQHKSLAALAESGKAAERKLQQVKQTVENAELMEAQLTEASNQLARAETTMASGDLYSWAINTIRQFKLAYRVEIPQFSPMDGPKDMSMLPGFPYKQATMVISGTAQFADFGKFIADFENEFPYIRVLNLTLEPVAAMVPTDRERLSFKLEIAALVKPANS